jgi:flagellar biosynthesis chaperone FliJ
MNKIVYPLKQVMEVKQRRVEEAEKVVKGKRAALEQEQKKLKEREEERDKVKRHREDKLRQLRETLDGGTTSPKIQQMKNYLKVVDDKLKIEEKKVRDQQQQVALAEKNLEQAKNELHLRRQEVDKLATHQKDWEKTTYKEIQIVEEREQDELGSLMHTIQHRHSLQ